MNHLVLFGPGYTGGRIAAAVEERGGRVTRVARATEREAIDHALLQATHVLSTVPPGDADPVLATHAPTIGRVPWIGYLSSTGVYGDVAGAWVDESAPLAGRRRERIAADQAWLALGARVFRLPGIYGPGRSVLDRMREGRAHRVALLGQVFSRVHVDDIVAGVLAAIERGPPGAYNLADDLPAPQDAVVEEACRLTGLPLPPIVPLESLSPMARSFYGEKRRVSAAKARRLLGWRPLYRTYREGLRALIATSSPASVSPTPTTAAPLQR